MMIDTSVPYLKHPGYNLKVVTRKAWILGHVVDSFFGQDIDSTSSPIYPHKQILLCRQHEHVLAVRITPDVALALALKLSARLVHSLRHSMDGLSRNV
jgi:DNA-binding GntR family transcriptional regulator